MASDRNLTIDIAKGLAIALVVFGHNPFMMRNWGGGLFLLIFSFHVPIFFFLSGLFVRAGDSVAGVIAIPIPKPRMISVAKTIV